MTDENKKDTPISTDEPGWAERFQRGLRNLINTPPKPRTPSAPKAKERPASKGRIHKGKKRS